MAHSDLVQSLLKGLSILDVLAESDRGMSLQDICKVLKLKQPTAYNLLRTLVARNYVERTAAPVRYRLGRTLIQLADEVRRQAIDTQAEDVLRNLYSEIVEVLPREPNTQEEVAVSYARSLGGEVRLLQRIRNDQPDIVARPMSVMDPYRSTSSLTYQAYWTREERDGYRRAHPFDPHGIQIWKTQRALNVALHEIRRKSIAQPDIYQRDEYRLSVPVFDEGHALTGVIGVGAWMRLNPLCRYRILRLAVEAAAAMSAVPHPARDHL